MNKVTFLFVIFTCFFLSTCSTTISKDNLQKNESKIEKEDSKKFPKNYLPYKKWVLAKNGLNVRKDPDSKSVKIGTVPFASEVTVLEDTDEYISIVDSDTRYLVSGAWVLIKRENIQGWIFDGYLGEYDTTIKIKYHDIIENFIRNPFTNKITFRDNLQESVLKQFGKPEKIITEKIENRHAPGTYDQEYTLIYNGLTFVIYHVNFDGKQILNKIEITNDKYQYKYNVNFIMKREDIEKIFGDPMKKDGTSFHYDTSLTTPYYFTTHPEDIKFYFNKNNKLEKIKIYYYFD